MPQTSVLQLAVPAQPGMPFDAEASTRDVTSVIASTNIPFGAYCEYVTVSGLNLLQVMQDPQTTGLLTQTVTATNGSASVTFSANVTLAKGTKLQFSGQPGVFYYLAAAITAATAGTLTNLFSGTTGAGQVVNTFFNPNAAGIALFDELGVEQNYVPFQVPPAAGSTSSGWLKGQAVPVMRRGRIWVVGDAGGTVVPTNTINVWHSSTGANPQGVFTYSPTAQTVGGEIDIAPGITPVQSTNTGVAYATSYTDPFGNIFKIYPVEINI
jgi:hypothetical protein